MLTPEQSRAARGLLDWSQTELAKQANLSESTVRDFEKGRRVPSPNNVLAIRNALERSGVSFVRDGFSSSEGGAGVRFTLASERGVRDAKVVMLRRRLAMILDEIRSDQSQLNYALSEPNERAENEKIAIEHMRQRIALNNEHVNDIVSEFSELVGHSVSLEEIFTLTFD